MAAVREQIIDRETGVIVLSQGSKAIEKVVFCA